MFTRFGVDMRHTRFKKKQLEKAPQRHRFVRLENPKSCAKICSSRRQPVTVWSSSKRKKMVFSKFRLNFRIIVMTDNRQCLIKIS